jgi:hypothetical protein
MEIKRSSWHYKLANFGIRRVWPGDRLNFCNYFWDVVRGGFLFLCLSAFVLGLTALTVFSLYDIIHWCVFGGIIQDYTKVFILSSSFALSISLMIGSAIWVADKIHARKYKTKIVEKEPGFLGIAYRKFKDKTCINVDIEDYDLKDYE